MQSALYENNAFLMAQHMMEGFMTGKPVTPMPDRVRAWALYDNFKTKDGELVFVGVVTDTQWKVFCEAFGLQALLADPALADVPPDVLRKAWDPADIMGRAAAHSGRIITWDEVMASEFRFCPDVDALTAKARAAGAVVERAMQGDEIALLQHLLERHAARPRRGSAALGHQDPHAERLGERVVDKSGSEIQAASPLQRPWLPAHHHV